MSSSSSSSEDVPDIKIGFMKMMNIPSSDEEENNTTPTTQPPTPPPPPNVHPYDDYGSMVISGNRFMIDALLKAYNKLVNGSHGHYGPAETNNTQCILTRCGLHRPNGYPQITIFSWTGRKCSVKGHHLTYALYNYEKYKVRGDREISHRCHNSRCINSWHLRLDTGEDNRDRNKCKGWTFITYPGGGDKKFNPCQHGQTAYDKCILPYD